MLISFIIPVYNRSNTIKRCLESILFSFSNNRDSFQIVIVDDKSQDDSIKIANQYLKDKKINKKIILNNTNRGSNYSRNIGLINSDGDWGVLLDSDDKLYIDSNNLINKFKKYKTTDFLSFRCINEDASFVGNKNANIIKFDYYNYINNYDKIFEKLDCINLSKLSNKEKLIFDENIYLGCEFVSWSRFLKEDRTNIILNDVGRIYFNDVDNQITKKTKKNRANDFFYAYKTFYIDNKSQLKTIYRLKIIIRIIFYFFLKMIF